MKRIALCLLVLAGCAEPHFYLSIRPLTPANIADEPPFIRLIPLPAFKLTVDNHSGQDLKFDDVEFHPYAHLDFLITALGRVGDIFFENGIWIKDGTKRTGYIAFKAWPPRPAGAYDAFLANAPGSLKLTFVDHQGLPHIFVWQLKVSP